MKYSMKYLLRGLSGLFLTLAIPHWAMALEIVPVQVISQSSATETNVPVTFGQVFKPGDVPADTALTAQLSDNTMVSLQVDKKATHRDGSLRHAVVTARIPSLAAGATQSLMLATGTPPAPGSDVTLANLLASGFDAEVSLSLGGTVYRATAKNLLQNGAPSQWLDGDLVSEWIVGAPVKDGAGKAHPHLAAYFHVRAYGPAPVSRVRVDVVVENNWSYQPNPRNFTYDATIRIAGDTVYTRNIEHYHHARWNQQFWWGGDPQIAVGHDRDYLLDSRAITNYDRSIQISEKSFKGMLSSWDPMSNGSINSVMTRAGAHDGIGPLPRWAATYVLSQDQRAKTATLLNGRASGSYSMHFRDQDTGLPVSLDEHPKAGKNNGDFAPIGSSKNPLIEDTAHHPDLAFVPYLVTGDYFFLEELQFWGNYNMLREAPSNRGDGGSRGLIVSGQLRGQAWGMRTLSEAAYATPDDHPLKDYFNEKVLNNITQYDKLYTNGESVSDSHWNVFGALIPSNLKRMNNSRPWMDDFFTWAMGHLVELGFTEAIPLRDWKAQYPVGRMTRMCYIEAVNYGPEIGTNDPPTFFTSWAQFYEVNYGSRTAGGSAFRDLACASQAMADWKSTAGDKGNSQGSSNWLVGEMSGRAYSDDSYYANAQPAMAIAKDSGIADADIAWALFVGENTDPRFPYVGTPLKPSYVDAPQWAVVPRTQTSSNPKPVIALSAQPNVVQSQGSTTLDWSASNADTCVAGGDWSGDKGISGSELVGPLDADAMFRLTCTGNGGTAKASVAVSVDLGGGGGTSGGGTSGGGTSGGGTSGGGTSGGGTSGGGSDSGGDSGGGTSDDGSSSGGGSGSGEDDTGEEEIGAGSFDIYALLTLLLGGLLRLVVQRRTSSICLEQYIPRLRQA
jgi:hypothetical protein